MRSTCPETEQTDAAEVATAKVSKPAKKVRWGIIGGACAIAVFYLTVAFVASWLILDRIAAQTSHSASAFGTWWQILIFVFDIVFALGVAAGYTMMIIGIKRGKRND